MRIPSGTVDQVCYFIAVEDKPTTAFGRDKTTRMGHKYECKECVNAKRRGRYQKENRAYTLKRNYGMTPAQYEEMKERQGGRCPICGEVPTQRSGGNRASSSTALHVDHDHVSGDVRGLLCHRCNVALGLLGDDPMRMERAAQYVRGLPVEYLGAVRCAS